MPLAPPVLAAGLSPIGRFAHASGRQITPAKVPTRPRPTRRHSAPLIQSTVDSIRTKAAEVLWLPCRATAACQEKTNQIVSPHNPSGAGRADVFEVGARAQRCQRKTQTSFPRTTEARGKNQPRQPLTGLLPRTSRVRLAPGPRSLNPAQPFPRTAPDPIPRSQFPQRPSQTQNVPPKNAVPPRQSKKHVIVARTCP